MDFGKCRHRAVFRMDAVRIQRSCNQAGVWGGEGVRDGFLEETQESRSGRMGQTSLGNEREEGHSRQREQQELSLRA